MVFLGAFQQQELTPEALDFTIWKKCAYLRTKFKP